MLYNSDEYKKIIDKYVKPFIKDESIFDNLRTYQLNSVKMPFEDKKCFECDYDFAEYFRNISSESNSVLKAQKTGYTFKAQKKYEDWPTFAKETVWYGRRKGATLYTNSVQNIETKHI